MANQAQKDAVVKLHGTQDGSDITSAYGNGVYNIARNDPYELAAVLVAGGVYPIPAPVVTGVTDGTAVDGASGSVIGTVDSVVTYSGASGTGELTYASANEAIATVDEFGVVTAGGTDGTTTITATSVEDTNFSGSTSATSYVS